MFTENAVFTGKTGDAVKSYLGEAHITILSGIKVTAQTLLDNMAAYKDGYRAIDSSTNFKLDEEAIQEFRKKLASNYEDTDEYTGKIRSALSEVSDISDVGMPDSNGVFDIHEQMDSDLIKLVSNVNSYERENVVRLENSVELLLENLQSCLSKIGLSQGAIESYETGSFITGKDAGALNTGIKIFGDLHEKNKEAYDEIYETEQKIKDEAEKRKTQGIWRMVGGAVLIATGVACIVLTGGAAIPIVADVAVAVGSGTAVFGAADAIEGTQDIYYGSTGDIDSTAVNGIKDDLFQGNEDAYYLTENAFAFAASAMIPIGQASTAGNLTFKSTATIVAKEGISMGAGAGAQKITTDVTGNDTAGMVAGMVASGVTAKGLNGIDTKFNVSGNKWYAESAYNEYKKLSDDSKVLTFNSLNSEEIYNIVKNSPESWAVEGYDLITSHNAKYFIKLTTNSIGEKTFNLDWPYYGGYEPDTIASIGELSGKIPVSRDGGDGGFTMGYGKNADGTYANNSERSIPKSSAKVNTGTFDVDLYKDTVDIVTVEDSMTCKIQKLIELGIDEDVAEDLLKDYLNWKERPEIIGENNISDGVEIAGNNVISKYGYYGKAAAWDVGDVHMKGGAGQMNTIYSWGTLKEAGIIFDMDTVVIK
ncbi:T7SS effector LXG polymorphic toxin [Agathobacter rectalis]|uniref:T7SS effector LXG polymorphic toxin n=1 Tax=Agathobacter rectalis TaxID=39491 RepID=UPI0027D294B7|nr:T7SS effector LXG polymorphic toxin [Agathobacter rectalis]UML65121.1 T7SS effector LXG polymorphic toxin [Agathobacter rectalis]